MTEPPPPPNPREECSRIPAALLVLALKLDAALAVQREAERWTRNAPPYSDE